MDPRLRRLNTFLGGACIGLTLYSAVGGGDRVAAALWGACAISFLIASRRD